MLTCASFPRSIHKLQNAAPLFGPYGWELPPQTGPLPEGPDRYKHFARLLLDGKVVSGFEVLAPWLNDRPSLVLRTWATPKVSRLLAALQLRRISSKRALQEAWESNPSFLYQEVSLWVRKEHHATLGRIWPMVEVPRVEARAEDKGSGDKPREDADVAAPICRQDEFASGSDSGEESD